MTDWGLAFQLKRSSRKTMAMEIRDGEIIVKVPFKCSEADINRFIASHRSWLDKHLEKHLTKISEAENQGALTDEDIKRLVAAAKKVIPERVKYYAEKADLTYGRIFIRSQSTRWGSCSSKGNLNFNCLLMLAPLSVIDSVVVHELCHLKEMNHSDRFYREVIKLYPDYYEQHKWLKDNGDVLIMRMKEGKNKI